MDPGLLVILCCPETHQPLRLLEPGVLGAINREIAAGRLRNRGGEAVTERIDGGLVREDGRWLYLIRAGVPVMLIDEAVPLADLTSAPL